MTVKNLIINLKTVIINKNLTVTRQTFIKGSHSTPVGINIYAREAGGTISVPSNVNTLWTADSKIYYYSEEAPTTSGNYWHDVNGEATAW